MVVLCGCSLSGAGCVASSIGRFAVRNFPDRFLYKRRAALGGDEHDPLEYLRGIRG